eukprot:1378843-Amphidinium_carterae.1
MEVLVGTTTPVVAVHSTFFNRSYLWQSVETCTEEWSLMEAVGCSLPQRSNVNDILHLRNM